MFVKMKIKCFSKRKLNVRISKTKIKCAILGFSQNCCIWGKSQNCGILGKIPRKIGQIQQKIQQILAKFAIFCKNQQKNSAIFNEKIEIRERCKVVFLGFDSKTVQRSALCRSRRELSNKQLIPTSIYLKNLASIKPRTSPVKFAGNIVLFRYFELSGI